MNQTTETVIPKYSLSRINGNEASLFDIRELKGHYKQHPDIFLVPHRKDYYVLGFVKQGSSRHWVDMTPYILKPETFYFSVPHQIHVKEQSEPFIGTMIYFTEEFLAIEENEFLKQLPIIKNTHNGHELHLTAENVMFIDDIMLKMVAEHQQRQDWRNSMLLGYLRVLLIYVSRLYTEQFQNTEKKEERLTLNKFKELIDEQHCQLHEVAYYADLMNISAGHLSEVVKLQSGKTAIEHIHERLMLEAKRLLFHTENSMKEIAFQLGFEDASYFNRFFKRLSSQTPLGYRNTTRNMYH